VDHETDDDFEEFVSTRYLRLVRTAYLLSGDHALAEDLVQATLAKTYLAWARVRRESADRYVHRILVNSHVSVRRRRWWREQPTESVELAGTDPYREVDDRDALRRVLRSLPGRQRAAVVLRFYEDLSEADTAEVLGCSVGTVKSLTSRGLSRLRAALGTATERGTATEQEVRP
jgi:RNA polymerase sigma-70 factor (sigma-E family)